MVCIGIELPAKIIQKRSYTSVLFFNAYLYELRLAVSIQR